MAERREELGVPWLIETSGRHAGFRNSIELLEETDKKHKLSNVVVRGLVQCPFGAMTSKPTRFMASMLSHELQERCARQAKWRRIPWSGAWHSGPHPSVGKAAGHEGQRLEAMYEATVGAARTACD